MDAGKLRHRITLQQQSREKDSLAGYLDSWEDVCTVWAEIRPVSSKEYLTQMREGITTHKIFMRYRPGITAKMRVAYQGRIFRIVAPPINWGERNEGLTLLCEEAAV